MRRLALPALLLAAGALAGCSAASAASTGPGPASPTASATPSENPYGAMPVDPPAPGEPILDVHGGRTPVSLSLAGLEELGTQEITVDEPFVKRRQGFTGVPLERVLAAGGIPATATVLTVALNDYRFASPVQALIDSQALIATRRDGAPIPYDQGGPIRLVFPDGTPLAADLDAWNWSLAEIRVG